MGTPNTGPVFRKVLEAASTDGTLGQQIDFSNFVNGTFYVVPSGTVTGGVISIEESAIKDYAGTWSLITASSAIGTGAQQALHLNVAENSYKYIHVRISDAITGGGTVEVYLQAN